MKRIQSVKKKILIKIPLIKMIIKVSLIISAILTLLYIGNNFANINYFSKKRAIKNAGLFIKKFNINQKRLSCTGKNINTTYKLKPGYGTCALVTDTNEKIFLQCPTSLIKNIFGGNICIEYFPVIQTTASNK